MMIVLTAAIAVFALCSVVVAILQWRAMTGQLKEMQSGGTDTHNLAVAAGNQATWTQSLADYMKTQADRTKDLADRMKDQADQTTTIAGQAVIQAEAAQSAAKTARRSLEISHRPWLVVKATVASPLTYDAQGANITIHYSIANIGNSPAIGIWVWPEFYILNGTKPAGMIERERICKELVARTTKFGQIVYPGQWIESNHEIHVSRADLDDSVRYFHDFFDSEIVDCIAYHANFSQEAYYTANSYSLGMLLPTGQTVAFPPYVEMPLGSLVLQPDPVSPTVAK